MLGTNRRSTRLTRSMEVAITTTCWVPDDRLREFLQIVIADAGVHRGATQARRQDGLLWLNEDGGLDQGDWDHIWELVALSDNFEAPWVCLTCRGPDGDEVRFEMARDVGYDGVTVRVALPPALAATAALARQTATTFGGGAGRE
jgi:hypothetical protein